jgi:hypothetical protein
MSVRPGCLPVARSEPTGPGHGSQEQELVHLAERPVHIGDRDPAQEGGDVGSLIRRQSPHEEKPIGRSGDQLLLGRRLASRRGGLSRWVRGRGRGTGSEPSAGSGERGRRGRRAATRRSLASAWPSLRRPCHVACSLGVPVTTYVAGDGPAAPAPMGPVRWWHVPHGWCVAAMTRRSHGPRYLRPSRRHASVVGRSRFPMGPRPDRRGRVGRLGPCASAGSSSASSP